MTLKKKSTCISRKKNAKLIPMNNASINTKRRSYINPKLDWKLIPPSTFKDYTNGCILCYSNPPRIQYFWRISTFLGCYSNTRLAEVACKAVDSNNHEGTKQINWTQVKPDKQQLDRTR